jgi:hypothetical protein
MQRPTLILKWRGQWQWGKREKGVGGVGGGGQRQWGICRNEGAFMQQHRVAIERSLLYAQRSWSTIDYIRAWSDLICMCKRA